MTAAVLDHTHVLVVGGTGTLGKAIAGHTASAGARVTLTSRAADTARRSAAEFEGEVTGVAFDVTDHDSVANLTAAGPFDHVVITAAAKVFDSLTDISSEDLDDLVSTKLLGTMWTARHLRPHVDERGSMLFISGMLARRPTTAAPLAAISGAVETLGVALAHEFAPVRVNVISPAAIGTTGVGGHAGGPGDVAALVTATLANRWINGTVLDIHGG